MSIEKKAAIWHQDVVRALREIFPHGHEDYLPLSIKELQLHSEKNHDYAKGGSALGNFDRVSKILALYPGLSLADRRVVALVYALKQLDAVLWGISQRIVHKVEGLNARLQDIAVYAKIVMCMNTDDARNAEIDRQFGIDLVNPTPKLAPGQNQGCGGAFASCDPQARSETPSAREAARRVQQAEDESRLLRKCVGSVKVSHDTVEEVPDNTPDGRYRS